MARSVARRSIPRRFSPALIPASSEIASSLSIARPVIFTSSTMRRPLAASAGGATNAAAKSSTSPKRRSRTMDSGRSLRRRSERCFGGVEPFSRRSSSRTPASAPALRRCPPSPGRTPSGASPGANGRAPLVGRRPFLLRSLIAQPAAARVQYAQDEVRDQQNSSPTR